MVFLWITLLRHYIYLHCFSISLFISSIDAHFPPFLNALFCIKSSPSSFWINITTVIYYLPFELASPFTIIFPVILLFSLYKSRISIYSFPFTYFHLLACILFQNFLSSKCQIRFHLICTLSILKHSSLLNVLLLSSILGHSYNIDL